MKLKCIISVLTAAAALSCGTAAQALPVENTGYTFYTDSHPQTWYSDGTLQLGNNYNAGSYWRSASPVCSYLTDCGSGVIMRFQYASLHVGYSYFSKNSPYMSIVADTYYAEDQRDIAQTVGGYLVEYYNRDYDILGSRIIPIELPLFGGFYSSDKYYFIVTGQENPECRDDKEVIRVTKYDKSWNRLSSASLYGENTSIPFDAGSLRMGSAGDWLIVRTCHEMYSGHQANLSFQMNMETDSVTQVISEVANANRGYVSHSFNQFVRIENNRIAAVDHGDAYPRSIVLTEYQKDLTDGSFVGEYITGCNVGRSAYDMCSTVDVLTIPGDIGNNNTGVNVGGFEISDTSYLIAGAQVCDPEKFCERTASSSCARVDMAKNAFIASVDKQTHEVSVKFLTDITDPDANGVQTPHLVKLNDNKFIVIWAEIKDEDQTVTYCAQLDGRGNVVGDVHSFNGDISDCEPVVIVDKIVWYVWWADTRTDFYEVDTNDLSNVKIVYNDSADYGSGICGDLDGDTVVTSSDALAMLQKSVSEYYKNDTVLRIADVNRDGEIDSADALETLRFSVGLSDNTAIGNKTVQ